MRGTLFARSPNRVSSSIDLNSRKNGGLSISENYNLMRNRLKPTSKMSTTSKFGLSAYKVDLDRTYSDDSVSSADESAKKLQSKEILTGILSLNNCMKKINSTTRINKLSGGGLGENTNKIESTTPKSFSMKNVNVTFKDCKNHINIKCEAEGMTKSTPRVASLSRSYFRKVSFSSTINNINKNKKLKFSKYSRKTDFSSSCIEKLQRKYCDYEYRLEDSIDTNNENTTSKSMNKSQSNFNNQNKQCCSITQNNKNKLGILEVDCNLDTKTQKINENLHLSKNNIVNISSPTMSMTKLKGGSNILNHKKKHNQDTFIEEIEIPATANKIKFKMNLEQDKTNPDKQKKSLLSSIYCCGNEDPKSSFEIELFPIAEKNSNYS